MNILIVNYMEVTSAGGINKAVRETAKGLSTFGHQVMVLQPNPFNLPNEEFYEGFKIIRVNSEIDSYFYGLNVKIYRHLKFAMNTKPDLVHIHGYHTLFSPEVIFLLKKINSKVKLIFSPHFGNPSCENFASKYLWDYYNKYIGEKIITFCDSICVASHYEADNLYKILKVPDTKINIIPHGVDIVDLNKKRHRTNIINLLYAGYLQEGKGIHHVIKALYILIFKLNVKANLTIIGEGDYGFKLKELANELNVDQFIRWRGFVSSKELVPEFKQADIFILASLSENYGIVVAESLALGTPVIVSKTTALNEFLNESGCFGVEYPPDPVKLAELVLEIYSSDVRVGPLSNKIKEWNKVAKEYELLYKRSLHESQ